MYLHDIINPLHTAVEASDTSQAQTRVRTHTRAHTPLTRPFIRSCTENGSSNLSLGLESTLYSNCSRDSWQKPRGIAKEHPLSVLPTTTLLLRLSTSTILVINFLPRLLRWCVCVCVCAVVTRYFIMCWSSYSPVCLPARLSGVCEF